MTALDDVETGRRIGWTEAIEMVRYRCADAKVHSDPQTQDVLEELLDHMEAIQP